MTDPLLIAKRAVWKRLEDAFISAIVCSLGPSINGQESCIAYESSCSKEFQMELDLGPRKVQPSHGALLAEKRILEASCSWRCAELANPERVGQSNKVRSNK